MELQTYRSEIDEIDRQLAALYVRRMAAAAKLADYKRRHNLPVRDARREAERLQAVAACVPEELRADIQTLYRTLMALSRDYQERLLKAEE